MVKGKGGRGGAAEMRKKQEDREWGGPGGGRARKVGGWGMDMTKGTLTGGGPY